MPEKWMKCRKRPIEVHFREVEGNEENIETLEKVMSSSIKLIEKQNAVQKEEKA